MLQVGSQQLGQAIQRLVEDPLSDELLRGTFKEGDTIKVDHKAGLEEFTFDKVTPRRRKSAATKESEKIESSG